MARDKKCRRICLKLNNRSFTAQNSNGRIVLALEELEAMRLADFEQLDQTAAALKMNISRGTFQRILYAGRHKVAEALVNGLSLEIEDAEPVRRQCHSAPFCRNCFFKQQSTLSDNQYKGEKMKIAVTCEKMEVFQHFGHTPEFALFDVVEGRLNGMKILPTGDSGHGALATLLAENGVDLLICGGIGGGAQNALAAAGIKLVGGASGNVIEAVGNYLKGELETNADFSCNHHHGDGEGHSCGDHHHGDGEGHSCGGHCHD